jgi:hypothetical protein
VRGYGKDLISRICSRNGVLNELIWSRNGVLDELLVRALHTVGALQTSAVLRDGLRMEVLRVVRYSLVPRGTVRGIEVLRIKALFGVKLIMLLQVSVPGRKVPLKDPRGRILRRQRVKNAPELQPKEPDTD